jgi:hypothetical protein
MGPTLAHSPRVLKTMAKKLLTDQGENMSGLQCGDPKFRHKGLRKSADALRAPHRIELGRWAAGAGRV